MVRQLKKKRVDGTPYRRRPEVETELEQLEGLTLAEVLARAREHRPRGETAVSSEALVYLLRREAQKGNARSPGVDGLVSILVARSKNILMRHISNEFDELQREEIYRGVVDRLIDEISEVSDRADYAEINFNHWLARKRYDACNKQKRRLERIRRVGDAVEDLAEDEPDIVRAGDATKAASPYSTPEAAYALSEAHAKARLPAQIQAAEFTPEDRYRIATAVRGAKLGPNVLNAFLLRHYYGMKIDSRKPDEHTLARHFGKSEKTIRNWLGSAEEAFAKLRGETDEDEQDGARELGCGAARLSS